MSIKLRDLIRKVRACKTQADERKVISKESAAIRSAFKDENNPYRHRNVAKLLFIHMLGHKSHFGQIECLALIASPKFAEKRIGYLAMMVLLHENNEVLMLGTNSLKQDLSNDNPYVVGLALCALGNISSSDIARDLQSETEKLLRHGNPYIRRKAVLVALRTIRKVPELISDFVPYVKTLISDQDHGVQICSMAFMKQIIELKPKYKSKFSKYIDILVKSLKKLVVSGYTPEYDVCGISDPFLQIKIMQVLRLLGMQNEENSVAMNDILAQVATNTEGTKTPGNAILYECVRTIMSIESETSLRVMGINILGRFLLNKDNNIRYVALSTLCQCVKTHDKAVQRHRNTIVDCLKDADISIRRRALDLVYALVNPTNVKALVKELLKYLSASVGDDQFKSDLTAKVTAVVDQLAPTPRWHIDTLIRIVQAAGNFTSNQVSWRLTTLIIKHEEIRSYSVHSVYSALKKDQSQVSLVYVGLWVLGEYSDILTSPASTQQAKEIAGDTSNEFQVETEQSLISLLETCLKTRKNEIIERFVMIAILKFAHKFPSSQAHLTSLLEPYRTSFAQELQTRSCEFLQLMTPELTELRNQLILPIPAVDLSKLSKGLGEQEGHVYSYPGDNGEEEQEEEEEEIQSTRKKKGKKSKQSKSSNAGDSIFDLFDTSTTTTNGTVPAEPTENPMAILTDIFGASTPTNTQQASNGTPTNQSGAPLDLFDSLPAVENQPIATPSSTSGPLDLMALDTTDGSQETGRMGSFDMSGMMQSSASPAHSQPSSSPMGVPQGRLVFRKNGLEIRETHENLGQDKMRIHLVFSKTIAEEIKEIELKVAVPKYLKMRLNPASGTSLGTDAQITQVIDIKRASVEKAVALRIKVDFDIGTSHYSEQDQISNFG